MPIIERPVSNFIDNQFPSFYKEQGPNFIAFVRAYYEWLESSDGAIGQARKLLDNSNIDLAEAQFVDYFKRTYIDAIPSSIAADKRLLIKYCRDLYRTKGSQRAIELLFRMMFDEDIEVYNPGEYLLRPSDGRWVTSEYIEVTSHPNLAVLVGRTITNSELSASAVVESVFSKLISGKTVNVVYLSSVNGTFKTGQRIVCDQLIDIDTAPIVIGSLSAIPVENGGFGFNVGEILDVYGSGQEGKARVVATKNEDGKVRFNLINGGSGYSVNAVVTVSKTLNLLLNGTSGAFAVNTSVVDSNTGANGTIVFANTTYLTLINFSSNLHFSTGDVVTSGNASATVVNTLGGGGSGAMFRVGGLVNKEIYLLNSDFINDYVSTKIDSQIRISTGAQTGPFLGGEQISSTANTLLLQGTYLTANQVPVGSALANATLGVSNLVVVTSDEKLVVVSGSEAALNNANLIAGATLSSNIASAVIVLDRQADKIVNTSNAIVFQSNSSSITANLVTGSPRFIPGATVLNLTTPTSNTTVVSSLRLTDWAFPARFPSLRSNLDSRIDETLTIYQREVGTIAFLTGINPGSGYSSPPFVTVTQPDVALLGESDGSGGVKGRNAVVTGTVSNERGVVTAVEVYQSGFGYIPNESLTLMNDRSEVAVQGVSVVIADGQGEGMWLGSRGFLSDLYKIQDSDYYQIYSYEIVAERMKDMYERLVNNLVHPAGYKMFGRFRRVVELTQGSVELVSSTVQQT